MSGHTKWSEIRHKLRDKIHTYEFTFMHLTYRVPSDVNVIVYEVTEKDRFGISTFPDFDFHKDGQIISMFGGTDEDGNPLPSWADVGIEKLSESTKHEELE